MTFQEALYKKHRATFKSVRDAAREIGMNDGWLKECLNGKGKPSKDMRRVLYNYYKLWEYGVEGYE